MKKISIINSTCVPLPIENVDTDQIIPARFLKATSKEGFGENLFRDWRFDKNNQPIESFVLNNPKYSGSILVAGKNFGSGSSREHAAWAVEDYGFQAVISSFFADIFKNNALNNSVLPIVVSEKYLEQLMTEVENNPSTVVNIDLPTQTVSFDLNGEIRTEKFEISGYKKACFLEGLDDIDYLLSRKEAIESFENGKK